MTSTVPPFLGPTVPLADVPLADGFLPDGSRARGLRAGGLRAGGLRAVGFLVEGLERHGDRTAVVTAEGRLSYAELADRVDTAARSLGPGRRLVLLAAVTTVDVLVSYLAALSAGHVVLLVPGDHPEATEALIAAYDPDVVVRPDGARTRVEQRREGSGHDLHPDLALLLSTSGSTGSPKLVRLSYANLQANAESIAEYLGLRPDDRAATTLPLYYCYGLSVVHSHLLRGAGLIMTSLSVVDACFWDLFRDARGTSLAGVPYTFDLLDRIGFDQMSLPHLRYVTQAGGRLAPARVARYAELGRRRGWDLVVMYGQTEATARMAYLPAHLAATHPHTIGIPIPGGSFRLEPLADDNPAAQDTQVYEVTEGGDGEGGDGEGGDGEGGDGEGGDGEGGAAGIRGGEDVGELVYRGPNVMMGYARTPADLALGATLDELRTGDLARRTDDGLYEIVGRRTRFAKLFGIRIDLQHVEDTLAGQGLRAGCAAGDDALDVMIEGDVMIDDVMIGGDGDTAPIRTLVARACRLPENAVRVHRLAALPRLATGKPDLVALRQLARDVRPAPPSPSPSGRTGRGGPAGGPVDVRRLFAELLHRDDVTDDSTFVSLGGDSLSYVELSLRLEDALGHLPPGWHTTPLRDLRPRAQPRRRGATGSIETSVLLRAVAIVLIVGTHANTFDAVGGILGGAHLLIAVAGFNVARFHLTAAPRRERVRGLLRSVAYIAVPSILFITALVLAMDEHGLANIVLLNSVFGPDLAGPPWEFWFVEALVQILLVLTALLSVPAFDRWQRRRPFAVAVAVLAVGLLTRFDVVALPPGPRHTQTSVAVLWLFALGWATAAATTVRQRLVVTAAAALSIPGFFADARREHVVLGGVLLLIWTATLRCPRPLRRLAGTLAASSLYIYLTHWQVFPHLQNDHPVLALLASLAVGVAAGKVSFHAMGLLGRWRPRDVPLVTSSSSKVSMS
ncbi:acyl-CoA synthetase (AMP-forming)/AMP-acid ligase II [Frankia sp. QA3]|nr:acyl-CoA synthetase (AMP-forming)/AMP-acid ligase II [Frankia sp. QA3]